MKVVRCADKCGARVTVSRTDDVPVWLVAFFTILNVGELTRAGFTKDEGVWRCRYCTRRRRLIRALPPLRSDVTDAPPPTDEKK